MLGMTYRIPVMENPNRWPGGGQLFGEFKHEKQYSLFPSRNVLFDTKYVQMYKNSLT